MSLLRDADVLVAETSAPSTGVGFEIASAIHQGKPVCCLYRVSAERKLSAMIDGNPNLSVIRYSTLDDLSPSLSSLLYSWKEKVEKRRAY
jgi:2'-deoxynucleoside 5'-phosphate N-hydrolase